MDEMAHVHSVGWAFWCLWRHDLPRRVNASGARCQADAARSV